MFKDFINIHTFPQSFKVVRGFTIYRFNIRFMQVKFWVYDTWIWIEDTDKLSSSLAVLWKIFEKRPKSGNTGRRKIKFQLRKSFHFFCWIDKVTFLSVYISSSTFIWKGTNRKVSILLHTGHTFKMYLSKQWMNNPTAKF